MKIKKVKISKIAKNKKLSLSPKDYITDATYIVNSVTDWEWQDNE
jgi:hypothetical protein